MALQKSMNYPTDEITPSKIVMFCQSKDHDYMNKEIPIRLKTNTAKCSYESR